MTDPARCAICDRTDCTRLSSVRAFHDGHFAGARDLSAEWRAMMDGERACEAARVDWRARALAAKREADRLRHGVPVEGDFVCPNALYRSTVGPLIEAVVAEYHDGSGYHELCNAIEKLDIANGALA